MAYAQTLKKGDTTYIWMGDVHTSTKVIRVDDRYIYTKKGRFGRKSGKSIDFSWKYLADAAGEK